ncbi:galanin peptides isoform X1 [Gouania willdenowi]|uniref:Galanin peptides n=1 Tax=Gouania willdenowi TaxID=441366 RepID=A0A8C5ENP6_GOUWI|nr:galanin peptides isoform X1 [Gouania willdenowi]
MLNFRENEGQQPDPSKMMQRCFGLFCVSLVFCATLSETIGLVIAAKEKRGWTLNSAGYLLGPRRIDHLIQIKDASSARGRDELVTQYGIDGHRTLGDKAGLAGKRDMGQDEDFRTGTLRLADEDVIHTVIDFLSYLKLKEMGALDSLPSSVTSDELTNP